MLGPAAWAKVLVSRAHTKLRVMDELPHERKHRWGDVALFVISLAGVG